MKNDQPQVPTFDSAIKRLQPICDIVREALDEGTLHVRKYAEREDEPIDPSLAPNLVRHKAKKRLAERGQVVSETQESKDGQESDSQDDATPDFETENISNNGLCLDATGFQVRILKSLNGSIPPPGKSLARQNFYNQRQGLLDFAEFRNGNPHVEPSFNLILHWTVNEDYILEKLCLALPVGLRKDDAGRAIVESEWDEPFWVRKPITTPAPQSVADADDLNLEEKLDEKKKKGPKAE